jgi:hypothetical protein
MRLGRYIFVGYVGLAGLGLGVAHAAPPPQALFKSGACPTGYYASGKYCVPNSNARFALPKNGSCPTGYFASGQYCVASSDKSRTAIPKSGSCPSGYFASGQYCVSNK